MPLPKMPTKPATMLLAKDYPKAEPGKSPVRPASAKTDADLEDLISGQAVPSPKAGKARKGKAANEPSVAAGVTGFQTHVVGRGPIGRRRAADDAVVVGRGYLIGE